MARKSFPKCSNRRASKCLDLVHTDVCGPMSTETPGRKKYFLTFIEDCSRYTVVYLLHSKDEVPDKLQEYIAYVSNKFGRMVKILRSDNGTEYTGRNTQAILKKAGIEFQTTVPFSPQQNGISERKNRYLCESARSMLFDAGLATKYWGEAIMTACYVQNRLPTRATDKTPYEMWNGEKPDLKHIRVFGSKAYAHVPTEKRTKWDSHSVDGVLVGYGDSSNGYRILVPNTGKVIISRSVIFDEGFDTTQKFIVVSDVVQSQPVSSTSAENGCSVPYLHTESGDKQIEIDIEETVKETEPVSEEPVNEEKEPLRRSVRQNKGIPAERYCMSYIARTQLSVEPESWTEMQKLSEHEKLKWIKAADEEIKSLKELQTWQLTELPTGKQAVGCKWVFKIKRDSEGKVHQYKARLVAKGYSQKYGEDYDATFCYFCTSSKADYFQNSFCYCSC